MVVSVHTSYKMFRIVIFTFCVLFLYQTLGVPIIEDGAEQKAGKFEGDMVLSARQVMELTGGYYSRNGLSADRYRWPNKTVSYRIAGRNFTTEQKDYILRAMETIANASCIRFVEVDESATRYVRILDDPFGCSSNVGYRGIRQDLNLAPDQLEEGCFKLGSIIHEFLHALGFYHMQSAADRDDYVTIVWENIHPYTLRNFEKYNSSHVNNFGEEYDYGSVLHYSDTAFSINGERTIIPRDETVTIGQRAGMSPSDIAKLRRMYDCDS